MQSRADKFKYFSLLTSVVKEEPDWILSTTPAAGKRNKQNKANRKTQEDEDTDEKMTQVAERPKQRRRLK